MNYIDSEILISHGVTVSDLYLGAFELKMKAEQLVREGKNADRLYESEYRIISALAEMEDPASMILLGEMLQGGRAPYEDGDPVLKAMDVWLKAAKKGEARGYTNIGLVYLHRAVPGGGDNFGSVTYDPEKALNYFRLGYDNGDSKAGRHIGLCYRDGIGTHPDPQLAYLWFCRAAQRNDSTARYLKAECLYYGNGVTQNRQQALEIMKELIAQNAHDAAKAHDFIQKNQ